eukprot:Awhi_evm1s6
MHKLFLYHEKESLVDFFREWRLHRVKLSKKLSEAEEIEELKSFLSGGLLHTLAAKSSLLPEEEMSDMAKFKQTMWGVIGWAPQFLEDTTLISKELFVESSDSEVSVLLRDLGLSLIKAAIFRVKVKRMVQDEITTGAARAKAVSDNHRQLTCGPAERMLAVGFSEPLVKTAFLKYGTSITSVLNVTLEKLKKKLRVRFSNMGDYERTVFDNVWDTKGLEGITDLLEKKSLGLKRKNVEEAPRRSKPITERMTGAPAMMGNVQESLEKKGGKDKGRRGGLQGRIGFKGKEQSPACWHCNSTEHLRMNCEKYKAHVAARNRPEHQEPLSHDPVDPFGQ